MHNRNNFKLKMPKMDAKCMYFLNGTLFWPKSKKNWPRHNLDNYIYKGTSRTVFFNFPSLQVPFKLQRIEGNCHAFSRDVPESCKSPNLSNGSHNDHSSGGLDFHKLIPINNSKNVTVVCPSIH